VASLLTFLALITLALKTWVEYRNSELRGTAFTPVPIARRAGLKIDMSVEVKNVTKKFGNFTALDT